MSIMLLMAVTLAVNLSGPAPVQEKEGNCVQITAMEEGLFLGRGMCGVVITLNPNPVRSDLRDYISHFDGSQGGIEALVPTFGTGTLDRLLDIVGGQNAVDDGDSGIKANGGNSL